MPLAKVVDFRYSAGLPTTFITSSTQPSYRSRNIMHRQPNTRHQVAALPNQRERWSSRSC
jgi:hypothetical protein